MIIAGLPKKAISDRLQIHRNTVTAWTHEPEFIRELHRRLDEISVENRLRRVRQTTAYLDRLHHIADQALTAAEIRPEDLAAQRAARRWLWMYRSLLAEERRTLTG